MSGNFAKKDELVAVVVSPGISAASWVHLTLPEPNPLTSSVSLSSSSLVHFLYALVAASHFLYVLVVAAASFSSCHSPPFSPPFSSPTKCATVFALFDGGSAFGDAHDDLFPEEAFPDALASARNSSSFPLSSDADPVPSATPRHSDHSRSRSDIADDPVPAAPPFLAAAPSSASLLALAAMSPDGDRLAALIAARRPSRSSIPAGRGPSAIAARQPPMSSAIRLPGPRWALTLPSRWHFHRLLTSCAVLPGRIRAIAAHSPAVPSSTCRSRMARSSAAANGRTKYDGSRAPVHRFRHCAASLPVHVKADG